MAELDSILPSSLSSIPHIEAYDLAAKELFAGIDISQVLVHLTETVNAVALDWLIAQWGLTGHGVDAANATEAVKRSLLRNAALTNSRRGTIWVLRRMFEVAGITEIEHVRADELSYTRFLDGSWFQNGALFLGYAYLWAEYAIKVHARSSATTISEAVMQQMDFVLLEYASARDRHIGFTVVGDFSDTVTASDSLLLTVTP